MSRKRREKASRNVEKNVEKRREKRREMSRNVEILKIEKFDQFGEFSRKKRPENPLEPLKYVKLASFKQLWNFPPTNFKKIKTSGDHQHVKISRNMINLGLIYGNNETIVRKNLRGSSKFQDFKKYGQSTDWFMRNMKKTSRNVLKHRDFS